jgi:regulation of enolase protein 1 (concanavalin A-like superfamily)
MCSTVLTNPFSDWSTAPYAHDAADFWLRATLQGGALRIQVSQDGVTWPLVRLCPFPAAESYLVGPMCCTPERAGLRVRFSDFRLTAPLDKALHDLT